MPRPRPDRGRARRGRPGSIRRAYSARAAACPPRAAAIAARDGKHIKDALEQALALDPGLQDAYFGIGLYHYYAAVAPVAAKMLRWLLLLPGGDREMGLREMLRARDGSQLLRDEADYQLHTLYVWYEKQPEEALAIVRRLQARHPHNPVFAQARAQWRVLRGERLGAARDGKRIKESLERALVLDPGLQEAYFGIGLYHYYAAVAPTAAKMLRWLLLLPGGDKTEGMQEMLRAREHGALLRDEADYQLQVIYLWYEKQPQRALDLLMQLRDRHLRNPLFPQLIAQVQDVYFHDLPGSLRTWRSLLDAARARRVAYADLAEVRARLGMASTLDRLNESDAAIEQLRAVIAMKPLAPFGAYAQAQRELARLLARSRAPR